MRTMQYYEAMPNNMLLVELKAHEAQIIEHQNLIQLIKNRTREIKSILAERAGELA